MIQEFFDSYEGRLVKAALVRAIRTAAQTAIAVIGSSQMVEEVDWRVVASSVALATILSLLMSIEGLPEVDDDRIVDEMLSEGDNEDAAEAGDEEEQDELE